MDDINDDINIDQMIDMIDMKKKEFDIIHDFYESVYQCLCAQYSTEYLKGSSFYVGLKLSKWWDKLEPTSEKFKQKMAKWYHIKEMLDKFINEE